MFDDHFSFGKAPPCNILAELGVLGALLGNNSHLVNCDILEPEHFFYEDHGQIFGAIRDGAVNGRRVDGVVLKDLFDNKILAQAMGQAMPLAVKEYAEVIFECAQQRSLIEIANELKDLAYARRPVTELASLAVGKIDRLANGHATSTMVSLDDAIARVIAKLDMAASTAVKTGFTCLDNRLIGGLEPGLVYVLAGRPGMGKSALAHQVCINAALNGVGVLEVSLEMSADQLARRTLAVATGVRLSDIRPGLANSTASNLVKSQIALKGLPITIDDTAGQTPAMIAAKAREMKRRHGLGLLMIDHLNLMRAEAADAKNGGTWAVGRASNTVLQIAKDCQCPVILCVQLNRGPEAREDHRPNLSDLRQSGDIEQDAFAVGFVYRPEYYDREPAQRENESAAQFEDRRSKWIDRSERDAGKAEIIWAKVRDGATGTDRLLFDGPTTSFREIVP